MQDNMYNFTSLHVHQKSKLQRSIDFVMDCFCRSESQVEIIPEIISIMRVLPRQKQINMPTCRAYMCG